MAKEQWNSYTRPSMKHLVVISLNNNWFSIDLGEPEILISTLRLTDVGTIVTFQSAELFAYFESLGRMLVPQVFDLQCLDKQMSQEGKEFRNPKKWHLLPFLKYHKVIPDDFVLNDASILYCLQAMGIVYSQLIDFDEEEKVRVETIEAEINKIIYKRQRQGVGINLDLAKNLSKKIEKEIYRDKNVLQLEHGIFDPENSSQQLAYIDKKKYNLIKSPQFTFKAWRSHDPVCALFYNILRNKADMNSLLFMLSHWGGSQKTKPTYFGFGTITSRITMREPALQNLRKQNRAVIIAESGYKLLYIDYSQFEAGILASLSEDPAMIKFYNASDIYTDIAKTVLGNKDHRSDAKILFYRYMYGDTSLPSAAVSYFTKFRKLDQFKKDIDERMELEGRIGTVNGNYRKKNGEAYSWALSHLIQATASLIYKNAVIRTGREAGQAKFLIPMHDATLYQIPEYCYDKVVKRIEEIYIDEFKKICPNIEVAVTSKDKFD